MTERSPVAPPAICGVVGGGRMGAGIAHALLLTGSEVVLVEAEESATLAARQRVVDARTGECRARHAVRVRRRGDRPYPGRSEG